MDPRNDGRARSRLQRPGVLALLAIGACAHEPAPASPSPPKARASQPHAAAPPVAAEPSPPPDPVMLEPAVGHGLAINPTPPEVPAATRLLGGPYVEVVQICVDTAGSVARATLLKGTDPSLDRSVGETVRKWKFRPLVTGGKATPFCYKATFSFRGE